MKQPSVVIRPVSTKFLIFSFLALFLSVEASAIIMRVDVSFSGTPTTPGYPENQDLFAGSFTALYDSTLVPETGFYFLPSVSPSALTFTAPHVGSRSFDSSNTFVTLGFEDSIVRRLVFGDDIDHFIVPNGNIDDFAVVINWASPRAEILYHVVDEPFLRHDDNITWSLSVTALEVPDTSSTIWLLTAGLIGMMTFRRKIGPTKSG